MEDLIPTIVVLVLGFAIYRWFFKSSTGTPASSNEIRGVTRSMVDTVHAAFPDIPIANIIYSLSRTRSAQATSEEILERGFLSAPPASFSIPASLLPDQATTQPSPSAPASASASSKASANGKKSQTLIERYNLATRLPSHKGKEKDPAEEGGSAPANGATATAPTATGTAVQGSHNDKAGWAETKEKREMGLRERKEKMILEARRRMLEKQEKAAQASSTAA